LNFFCFDKFKTSALSQSFAQFMVMVLSGTFNNISVISWRSALLMEKTGVLGENHRHAAGH
jgi:hypothetical protein